MARKVKAAKPPMPRAKAKVLRDDVTGKFGPLLEQARSRGLLSDKTARIGGRVNPALIETAKRSSGVTTDSELIELALANLAVEDDFAARLRRGAGRSRSRPRPRLLNGGFRLRQGRSVRGKAPESRPEASGRRAASVPDRRRLGRPGADARHVRLRRPAPGSFAETGRGGDRRPGQPSLGGLHGRDVPSPGGFAAGRSAHARRDRGDPPVDRSCPVTASSCPRCPGRRHGSGRSRASSAGPWGTTATPSYARSTTRSSSSRRCGTVSRSSHATSATSICCCRWFPREGCCSTVASPDRTSRAGQSLEERGAPPPVREMSAFRVVPAAEGGRERRENVRLPCGAWARRAMSGFPCCTGRPGNVGVPCCAGQAAGHRPPASFKRSP